MPPRDPRESPALEEAAPSDGIRDGTWHADGTPAEALFGDGSWRLVTIVARWEDSRGRPVIQLEWSAALAMWGGTFLFDGQKVRAP